MLEGAAGYAWISRRGIVHTEEVALFHTLCQPERGAPMSSVWISRKETALTANSVLSPIPQIKMIQLKRQVVIYGEDTAASRVLISRKALALMAMIVDSLMVRKRKMVQMRKEV